MWDVLSIDEVKKQSTTIRDTKLLSKLLTKMAYEKRIELNMHIDDITVQVVDVNPLLFAPSKYVLNSYNKNKSSGNNGVSSNCGVNCNIS
jgi:hypothetical protein